MRDQMQQVAMELERFNLPGGVLSSDSPWSSVNLFGDADLAIRAADIGLEYLSRQSNVANEGRAAIVTAGAPGAGKTTTLINEGLLRPDWRDIDADLVKEMLVERARTEGTYDTLLRLPLADAKAVMPMELSTLLHRESTAIAQNLLEVCAKNGENVIVQGTLAWEQQPDLLLSMLGSHSYDSLTIVNVDTDVTTAIARARTRWWNARNATEAGGRFVPERFIRDLYDADGMSKCLQNAHYMFERASIPETKLLTAIADAAPVSRRKVSGQEVPERVDTSVSTDADN